MQLDDAIGYLLVQVCKAHRNHAERRLSALGLHAGQEVVLIQLNREDGQTQTQLADALCIQPPTVTKMITRMERAGLVARCPDADDARVSRVYLTDESRALHAAVPAVWSALDAQTLQGVSDEDVATMRRVLRLMLNNLTDSSEPSEPTIC